MILPLHLAVTTANTPQAIFSSTANLNLASMVQNSNTLAMYGLGALPVGIFGIQRIALSSDTAGTLLLGVYNGVNFYEMWRIGPLVANVQFDVDFVLKSKTTAVADPLDVPQSNSYVPAFKLATAPGATVNIQGFIQIANIIPTNFTTPAIIT